MRRDDMDQLTREFLGAAELALSCDFDVIEIDASGGGLIASFLSPLTNCRDDDYGGDAVGRMRYPLEILSRVRASWPSERPLGVRLSVCEYLRGGLSLADGTLFARAFRRAGVDYVTVVSGGIVAADLVPDGRLFRAEVADRIRQESGVPTVCEGGISSPSDINTLLAAGRADLVSLGRALIFDPHFVRRAAQAADVDLAWPAPYRRAEHFVPRL